MKKQWLYADTPLFQVPAIMSHCFARLCNIFLAENTWKTDLWNCRAGYQCAITSFAIHTPIILSTSGKWTPRTYSIFCLLKENDLHRPLCVQVF